MSELAINHEKERMATVRQLGERALWHVGVFKAELGVNDPLTHLEQYLEKGEAAMASIDEDFITDCAERLEKPVFWNRVQFDRTGDDFVSRQNRFSMRDMTRTTEYKFAGNAVDLKLYKRAKIESREVDELNRWFETAESGDGFVVESVGLTDTETYNIMRIHQKISPTELTEHIITLHNSRVDTFNELHAELGLDIAQSSDQLELLANMYGVRPPAGQTLESFIENYITAHDRILERDNPDQKISHGLPVRERDGPDDMELIRRQTTLRSIYLDNIRVLGASGGRVTPALVDINHQLKLGITLSEGKAISTDTARKILDSSAQYVMATLNRADKQELEQLAAASKADAVESAGGYGTAAVSEGVRYEGACPSGPGAPAAAEAAALGHAYRKDQDPSRCGTCPYCSKQYFVPENAYKDKILQCDNCYAAMHFDGSPLSAEELEKYRRPMPVSFLDMLIATFAEFNRRYEAEQAAKKAAAVTREEAKAA